jgi:hypothetical protein
MAPSPKPITTLRFDPRDDLAYIFLAQLEAVAFHRSENTSFECLIASRQRIVELFPTAHRRVDVASSRQRIAPKMAEANAVHGNWAFVLSRAVGNDVSVPA